ncbi:MAG: Na+/H+ antiporter subunit E [Pseudochelatococcus sp.]|uniref:Na+/H+ antiporter subunit E n=1 Tax=Pseudochelatococcus sp. TaxID=2020869 RepID=UPI003D8B3755
MFIFLLILWAALNSSAGPVLLAAGGAAALAIARPMSDPACFRSARAWRAVPVAPVALLHVLACLGLSLMELVWANIGLLRHIYARRIDIRPDLVRVDIRLTSPPGRLALANAVTLAPGALVLGLDGEALHVHRLDAHADADGEAMRRRIRRFEKRLEAAFG